MTAAERETVLVWGTRFVPWTLPRVLDEIDRLIQVGRPTFFVTANVHTLMVADADPEMRRALDEAAFVLADGMPIVWGSKLAGRPLPVRVAGADLLPALCERSARLGHRLYFYGGPPGVADEAASRLAVRFPGLQVVGAESPPYRPLTDDEERDLTARVRAAAPHVMIVLLGQPKGELWIRRHLTALGVPVSVQLGAAADFASGRVRRAPRWVQRAGLEWVYRISREPRRLTGRYARNLWFLSRAAASDLVRHRPN